MYLFTLVHSLCDQLYDEPHLDGKDKDAAGEKVSQVSAKPYAGSWVRVLFLNDTGYFRGLFNVFAGL